MIIFGQVLRLKYLIGRLWYILNMISQLQFSYYFLNLCRHESINYLYASFFIFFIAPPFLAIDLYRLIFFSFNHGNMNSASHAEFSSLKNLSRSNHDDDYLLYL